MEYIIPQKTSLEEHLQVSDPLFLDFVKYLLEINPQNRPTASEALQHPWLSSPVIQQFWIFFHSFIPKWPHLSPAAPTWFMEFWSFCQPAPRYVNLGPYLTRAVTVRFMWLSAHLGFFLLKVAFCPFCFACLLTYHVNSLWSIYTHCKEVGAYLYKFHNFTVSYLHNYTSHEPTYLSLILILYAFL